MISPPEPLDAGHDLSGFDCGKPALNDWLRIHALANQARGFTRVMVVCDGKQVVGFYGLAPTAVPPPLLTRRLRTGRPPDPCPASCSDNWPSMRDTPGADWVAPCFATRWNAA